MPGRNSQRADALVESGLRKIQEGQPVQARALCEQALDLAPRHPEALHLLGVLALQAGDPVAAIERLQQAVAIRPDRPDYRANAAYAYAALKRFPEALAAFEHAARLAPADPELQLGVGNCLGMLGRATEAEAAFRKLVARHPAYPLGWFNLANAVRDLKRHEEALEPYQRTVQLAPRFPEGHCNLGLVLNKLNRFDEAERAFRACLALKPRHPPAQVGLALALNYLRRPEEAIALCRAALAEDPANNNAWAVLGYALVAQGRWNEALESFRKWSSANPRSGEALANVGDILARTGRTKEALDAFDRAYAFGVSPFLRLFKASLLFSLGRMLDAAGEYFGRHERSAFVAEHPEIPIVDRLPADIAGREVGLIGEQGIGDELFFLRHASELKARGCRVSYCGNSKITGILARHALFERAGSSYGNVATADYRVLLGDLAHLLADPHTTPYATGMPAGAGTASARWAHHPWHCRAYWPALPLPLALEPLAERIAAVTDRLRHLGPPPYVGVTWRAGTAPEEQKGDLLLSLFKEAPAAALGGALRGASGTLVSLQRRPRPGETQQLAALAGRPVHDLSAVNDDLEDMLALLAVLDEYVGVSNTNMHLRACAGRTGRVLVTWPAEWRWMAAGDSSPWYPGFRVYRQRADGDWSAAMQRLANDLANGDGGSR
jgi:tetratricopeptide (TPR) repeat protein